MIFAEYICHKSHKYIIQSLIVMVALMMTGKRTLFYYTNSSFANLCYTFFQKQ